MTSLGRWLREEREARSISLEEIAAATKIVPRYLEALEDDRLDLMPGGFFIRGIIRAYAKAVGLDPEEVLARYKDAGILAPPERGRAPFATTAVPPTLPHAGPAPAEEPAAAVRAEGAVEPPGHETEKPEPDLVFEEAAGPRPPSETRRTVRLWALRGLAGLCLLGVALVLWSPWRHWPAVPPENPPAAKAEPSATAAPGAALSTAVPPAAEPAATKPEPAPAAEEASQGLTIEIVFDAETWIRVYADGELQIDGLFPAGASARAHAGQKLLIHTGNAGGFSFKLNSHPAKPLGRSGEVRTDIKITLENLKDFLEAPSAGPPAG